MAWVICTFQEIKLLNFPKYPQSGEIMWAERATHRGHVFRKSYKIKHLSSFVNGKTIHLMGMASGSYRIVQHLPLRRCATLARSDKNFKT